MNQIGKHTNRLGSYTQYFFETLDLKPETYRYNTKLIVEKRVHQKSVQLFFIECIKMWIHFLVKFHSDTVDTKVNSLNESKR